MPRQLKRFRHFAKHLKADQELQKLVESVELFRYDAEKWYREDGQLVEDKVLCTHLLHVHEHEQHWREKKSSTALIDIYPFAAVARTVFKAPPRKTSLDKVHARLEEARKHSEHEFDAEHDSLTGLLNGKGFAESIKTLVASTKTRPDDKDLTTPSTVATASTLAMMAMDIDHFKQINDTFGHVYGDIVLKCLAKRLDDIAREFEDGSQDGLGVCAARPSGEEFLLMMSGSLDIEQMKRLADRVRTTISDRPLPSDDEWALLAHEDSKKANFPPIINRRVTVSVGVASMPMSKTVRIEQVLHSLRSQADLALYSAKSGGRNAVRHFSEILPKHGHIIQHHSETDIVAIDLGRRVNVPLGQEFYVFHPLFDGLTPFTRSDGRTTKTLGVYPRKAVGRIVVIDVQQDISFCRIASRECPSLFPEGSHLEAIPVGSIAHLMSGLSFGGVAAGLNLMPAEQLNKTIAEVEAGAEFPVVAVFSVDNIDTLVQDRGTAFINESLAQLFAAMKEILPSACQIGQVQNTEFAAICKIEHSSAIGIAKEVISQASTKCNRLATFSAGVWWDSPTPPKRAPSDRSILKRENALEYARYAAAQARKDGNEVLAFSAETAVDIMRHLHDKQLDQQAIEDYKAFRALGIAYSRVENLAGICAFAIGERELALAASSRAVELDPANGIMWSNLSIYQFSVGERRAAYASLSKAVAVSPRYSPSPAVQRVWALSTYAEYLANGDIDPNHLIGLLEKTAENQLTFYRASVAEVHAAIEDVRERVKALGIQAG